MLSWDTPAESNFSAVEKCYADAATVAWAAKECEHRHPSDVAVLIIPTITVPGHGH